MVDQCVRNRLQIAHDYLIEFVQRKVDAVVKVEGLTPSSYSFKREFIIDRLKITEDNTIHLKPDDFLQFLTMAVDDQDENLSLENEVLDMRIEYEIAREKHRAWLGYLSSQEPIHLMVPREKFREAHKSFAIYVNRVDVTTNEMRPFVKRYDKVPESVVVNSEWLQGSKQDQAAPLAKVQKVSPGQDKAPAKPRPAKPRPAKQSAGTPKPRPPKQSEGTAVTQKTEKESGWFDWLPFVGDDEEEEEKEPTKEKVDIKIKDTSQGEPIQTEKEEDDDGWFGWLGSFFNGDDSQEEGE